MGKNILCRDRAIRAAHIAGLSVPLFFTPMDIGMKTGSQESHLLLLLILHLQLDLSGQLSAVRCFLTQT